jgi:hypothetical protein
LKGAAIVAGVALLAWAGLLELGGEVTQAVFPRFLDPRGDHPPYSKLKLEVVPGRAEVLYGGQVEIRATAAGRPVDKLWLVARAVTNSSRTIMFLAPDKSFFQSLANLREPTEYFVTDGQARSRRFPIGIRYTPQITLVEVTTEFPSYTSKATKTAKLVDEPQALPEDTRVSFRVASNRPLQSGALTLTPVLGGKPVVVALPPETDPNNVVTGSFTLTTPVAFTLSIRDVDGLECAEPRRGRFNISPDERPRLFVLEPGRNAVATPSISVPVKVQAQDDYGITRVVWLRGHNRSIERPFRMKVALQGRPAVGRVQRRAGPGPARRASGRCDRLLLRGRGQLSQGPERRAQPDVSPGDYFRRAIQGGPAPGRRAQGAVRTVFQNGRVDAAHGRAIAQCSAQADKADPAARAQAESLSEQMEKYDRELSKLLGNPTMFDVEESFRGRSAISDPTGRGAQETEGALAGGKLDPKQLKELAEQLSQMSRTEQEQVTQPAQQIASVVQVASRADAFVRLAQQQAALAQMLRRFSDRTNALSRVEQMEVQELAHQEQRVQEGLRTLLRQLPELLAKVPETPNTTRCATT